ncbi:MAG: tetratricopeptide repeat protein [Gemmatimonadales bacterium]
MAISEIEKLERRYAENPQGLTFAPLAEVHRKNGDTARALDLLRPGLELHPEYIPASIVLGRCHLDLGDLPAAEIAFTHVLGLDSENVIALKALADINERLFRFDDAERWLRTLLSVDRSNDEARDQLERVEASRRQADAASSADPAASLVTEPDGESAAAAQTRAAEPSEALSVTPPEPAVPLDLEELDIAAEASEPQAEGLELEQPVTMDETVTPLEGLVGRDQTTEPGEDDLVSMAEPDAFRVELSEEIVLQSAGGGEFQVPNAAEELAGRSAAARTDAPMAEPPAAEPTTAEAPAAEPPEPSLPEAEPVTAEASQADHGMVVKDTHGQSVADFFRGLLAARLPALSASPTGKVDRAEPAPAAEAEGAPTRPAHDSLSLSSVFGDEGTPTPPAVPVSAAAAPPAPADGSVSFDEFYSPAGRTDAPRQARTSDTKSDDLDQFHAWLQNLKR